MNFNNISSKKGDFMDNFVKYKLSQYKAIRQLNDENTVVLCYDISNDKTCVKKIVNKTAFEIYKQIVDIKSDFLPEIYEIFEYENDYIIVEEYIKGNSIEEIINEKGNLSESEALKYMLDICNALEEVHNKNIVHRDVSPDNVIISENNKAVLLDFDIARMGGKNKTTDTTILGTAGFASPEQFDFAQTDRRSDIYSLGVLLNYMLTGHILQSDIYGKEPFKTIILKATQIDPHFRYENILDMKEDIYKCIKVIGDSSKFEDINYINGSSKNKSGNKFKLNRIPGFRTGNPQRMVIAACIYTMCIIFFIGLVSDHKGIGYVLDYMVGYLMMFIIPMWWFGGNGSQWNIIPGIAKLKYNEKRVLAIIIYVVVLASVCLLLGN